MLIDEEQIRRLNKTMSIGGSVFDNSKNTVPEDIKCSNCSISKEDWDSDDNSSNWEPLRKSEEGPETALKDSDDDCAVPVCPVLVHHSKTTQTKRTSPRRNGTSMITYQTMTLLREIVSCPIAARMRKTRSLCQGPRAQKQC